MTRVPDSQTPNKGRLTVNSVVANFCGPVKPLTCYQICFLRQVNAKYVTLQIIGTSMLEINEVVPILPGTFQC